MVSIIYLAGSVQQVRNLRLLSLEQGEGHGKQGVQAVQKRPRKPETPLDGQAPPGAARVLSAGKRLFTFNLSRLQEISTTS
jgi:hypothetical protein